LKYDNCNNEGLDPRQRYPVMRDALNQSGRTIFYELCEWGVATPSNWARPVGNSWRTTGDIGSPSWTNMLSNLDLNDQAWKAAGPAGWNDPDNLQVGNSINGQSLTLDEQIAQFSLWSIIKAPLLLGNDIRSMTQQTLDILTNKEAIAINQDWLGVQGHRVASTPGKSGSLDVYAGPLGGGDVAVVLLNRDASAQLINASFPDIGLAITDTVTVRDIWKKTSGMASGNVSAIVNSHGAAFFRLSPMKVRDDLAKAESRED